MRFMARLRIKTHMSFNAEKREFVSKIALFTVYAQEIWVYPQVIHKKRGVIHKLNFVAGTKKGAF